MEDAAAGPTRWNSLDGVRALAVVLVIATHFGLHAPEGQIGVDVFFVLSGFLITSLLLKERDRTHRVSLANFWRRRALRLFPALGCAIVLALALSLTTTSALRHGTLGDLPFVFAYMGNWALVFGPPQVGGLLSHTWSLAIEEQFYLIWPLVAVAWLCRTRNRRRAAQVIAAIAAADAIYFLIALAHWGPGRAIFATDTHAFGLLAGSALALWVFRRNEIAQLNGPSKNFLCATGAAAAVLIVAFAGSEQPDQVIIPATACGAVLVASLVLVPTGPLVRVFSCSPLQWIGRRSYGIYLYHYPLAAAFVGGHHLQGFRFVATVVACVTVSLLLAAASYRWVETPLLRRKVRISSRQPTPVTAGSAQMGVISQ
jgi:peptidoglycan/LPS O-acetylase OafA/YrhL